MTTALEASTQRLIISERTTAGRLKYMARNGAEITGSHKALEDLRQAERLAVANLEAIRALLATVGARVP